VAERLTKKQRRDQTQAKIAAMRAAQARKERMRRLYVALAAVLTVVVIVGVLVIVKVAGGGQTKAATPTTAASDAVVNAVGGVPATAFDTVGAGTVNTPPKAMTGAEAITADGKPRVLYVGAEYCPFCAAERWAIVAALSRFGSFANLGSTTSAGSPEVYPNTATLSFHGSTYTSSYLSFSAYEETTNQRQGNSYKPLDTIPAADQALVSKYDNAPYVSSDSAGAIPFVDIGGKFVISGASYDPQVLQGKTHEQIAQALSDPTSAIAKAVDGSANVITAALCQLTKDQPAAVCGSAGVKAGAAKLANGS
jgi:Domain of unknown function (DUF929)